MQSAFFSNKIRIHAILCDKLGMSTLLNYTPVLNCDYVVGIFYGVKAMRYHNFGLAPGKLAESAYVKFSHNYSSAQANPNSSALPLNSSERSYTAFVITYSPLFTKTSIIFSSA